MSGTSDKMPARSSLARASYAPDGPSADQMVAVLAQYGIDAWKTGGVKDIYKIGGDIAGEEIMVRTEDLERAAMILQQMTGSSSPEADTSRRSVRKTVLSLLAALALLVLLLAVRGAFL